MIYKIYKIECLTTGKIYIGQTRNFINTRICHHISVFNNKRDFCYSHDVLLNNNFSVEIIDEVEDIEGSEAYRNLESFYMKYFKSINGNSYHYGSKEKQRGVQDEKIIQSKNIKIKYDYKNIKRNILNIEGAEEIKNKHKLDFSLKYPKYYN